MFITVAEELITNETLNLKQCLQLADRFEHTEQFQDDLIKVRIKHRISPLAGKAFENYQDYLALEAKITGKLETDVLELCRKHNFPIHYNLTMMFIVLSGKLIPPLKQDFQLFHKSFESDHHEADWTDSREAFLEHIEQLYDAGSIIMSVNENMTKTYLKNLIFSNWEVIEPLIAELPTIKFSKFSKRVLGRIIDKLILQGFTYKEITSVLYENIPVTSSLYEKTMDENFIRVTHADWKKSIK